MKKRTSIERLFQSGKSFSIFPFKVVCMMSPLAVQELAISRSGNGTSNLQFGVSVGKRSFKKAVDRNRIKRLIREAYRVEKLILLPLLNENMRVELFVIYIGKELPLFSFVQEKIKLVVLRLMQEIEKKG